MLTAKEASGISVHAFDEDSFMFERIECHIRSAAREGRHSTTVTFSGVFECSLEQIKGIRAILNRNGYLTEYNENYNRMEILW